MRTKAIALKEEKCREKPNTKIVTNVRAKGRDNCITGERGKCKQNSKHIFRHQIMIKNYYKYSYCTKYYYQYY